MFFQELVHGLIFVFTYKFYLCLLKPSSVILLPRCIVENIIVKIHVLNVLLFIIGCLLNFALCLIYLHMQRTVHL